MGSDGHKYYPCGLSYPWMWSVVTKCTYLIPHLHICSDWLITKKSNIQSFVWATLMKLSMWVVGAQVQPTWSVVTECVYLIHHLHICSDWLITKKSNIQSSVWATLMKLGMWVVIGTCTTHVVCRHGMCISNTSFAYLICSDWLIAKSQISRVPYGLH